VLVLVLVLLLLLLVVEEQVMQVERLPLQPLPSYTRYLLCYTRYMLCKSCISRAPAPANPVMLCTLHVMQVIHVECLPLQSLRPHAAMHPTH
jgi:hypothetical protein